MGPIPPWSDLPQELLASIANCLLSNPIDILSFRSVCKSWFSALSSSPPSTLSPLLPAKTPFPPFFLRNSIRSVADVAVLSVTIVYALRPPAASMLASSSSSSVPSTWLLFVDQLNPGKVSIRQPLSCWSCSTPNCIPRCLNLMDFHVSEIGRFYNLNDVYNRRGNLTKRGAWSGDTLKVILFSNGLAALVLFNEGKLGLTRLGVENHYTQWEVIHDAKGFRFDDIVDYKGRVLGIDRRGRVYEIGYHNSSKMSVIVPPIAGGGGRRKRLVESLGVLYLVVRCNFRVGTDGAAWFKVYELNEESKKWVEVTSIGDRIFFLGLNFSFSASALEFSGSCGKNCIIFKERSFQNCSGHGDDDHTLFHKLRSSDLRIGVWHLEDAAHLGAIESYPGYSNILWPPPFWIWPDDLSERLGTVEATIDTILKRILGEHIKVSSGDLIRQNACQILRLGQKMKKMLNEFREKNKYMKSVEKKAVSREQDSKSINLPSQVGTSSLGTEERHGSADLVHSATEHSNSDGIWLSSEMKHNLILQLEECCRNGDGIWLSSEMKHNLILRLEECCRKFEEIVKSHLRFARANYFSSR